MEVKVDKKVEVKKEKILSPWKIVWLRLKRNKLAIAGLYILVAMMLLSFIGPFFSPFDLTDYNVTDRMLAPSATHWLGTDDLGRDVLTRLMVGGRISLLVGIVAVAIEVVIGSILGVVAGFYGGIADGLIMRLVDIILCVPALPMYIILGAILSDLKFPPKYRIFIVMFVIGILAWPMLCRLVRGQILTLREQDFMQATEALGLRDRRKMFKHLLPNTFPQIIVTATLGIGGAIMSESALSFLGMGVMPPTPSWGNMIQIVRDTYALQNRPWLWMPPGTLIFLTIMAINLFGDGLRDALDPKLKR